MTDLDLQWLEEAASHFKSRQLFYPCSGSDIFDPINIFLPHVEEFWFADLRYESSVNHPKLPETEFRPISHNDRELSGYTLKHNKPFTISIHTHKYVHHATEKEITINFCAGHGYNVFRAALRNNNIKLSVFFYRGDSTGDGGSGFCWLKRKLLRYVLTEIEAGGLLISDGSNAIPELSICHHTNTFGEDAIAKSKSFSHRDHQLKCRGYLGQKNGPTLAWHVSR